MKARRSVIALASIALLAAPVLAACGGSSADSSSSSSAAASSLTPEPSASATSTEPVVGGDPSTWTPVSITTDMNGKKVKLVVGQFANFEDLPANTKKKTVVVHAKKKGVVRVSQQTDTSKAGFQAIAPGRTRVTVWSDNPKDKNASVLMYIIVKVKKAPATT